MNTNKFTDCIIEILRCCANGTLYKKFPADFDEEKFIVFCEFHKLLNVVYLTAADAFSDSSKRVLEAKYNKSLYIMASQQYYLEEIEREFNKYGIDYLILKGRELARLYPEEDMRESADFDIYIGPENSMKAKDLMENIGFTVVAYNDANDDHDEYIIDNVAFCELHRVLIQDDHAWREECNKIPQRLVRSGENKHSCKMNNEDFYVYNLAHAAKHMKLSGIGIRAFFDQWLIYRKFKDEFDYEYLNNTLRKANLSEFDKCAKDLYLYWFNGTEPENVQLTQKMADYVAKSGWVGTYEQFNASQAAENAGVTNSKLFAKIVHCLKIINAPYCEMTERYPILCKHKWLMPFCRAHRAVRALFCRRELVKQITNEYDRADMQFGKNIVKFKRDIGL